MASDMEPWSDARLELLHDHYKETFSYIRDREKQRDGLFILVIALLGVLHLELQYPANFQAMFTEVGAQGAKVDLRAVPLAAIMSLTWTLVLIFVMRYCQAAILIERQYKYLHNLESKMCSITGDSEVFCREGAAYQKDYPLFSTAVWVFYTLIFPLIMVLAFLPLLVVEWSSPRHPIGHKLYDTAVALTVIVCFVLYRTTPQVLKRLARRQSLPKEQEPDSPVEAG